MQRCLQGTYRPGLAPSAGRRGCRAIGETAGTPGARRVEPIPYAGGSPQPAGRATPALRSVVTRRRTQSSPLTGWLAWDEQEDRGPRVAQGSPWWGRGIWRWIVRCQPGCRSRRLRRPRGPAGARRGAVYCGVGHCLSSLASHRWVPSGSSTAPAGLRRRRSKLSGTPSQRCTDFARLRACQRRFKTSMRTRPTPWDRSPTAFARPSDRSATRRERPLGP